MRGGGRVRGGEDERYDRLLKNMKKNNVDKEGPRPPERWVRGAQPPGKRIKRVYILIYVYIAIYVHIYTLVEP